MVHPSSGSRALYKCKLVVTGDGACGKTCLLVRVVDNTFCKGYVPTVFDMYADTMPYLDGEVEISLWDTAGQEDFDSLRRLSYDEADVVMICYCVDNIDSIVNVVEKWAPEASSKAPQASIILCGCKSDQRTEDDNAAGHVPREKAHMFAQSIGAHALLETSALTGEVRAYCVRAMSRVQGTDSVLETVVKVWAARANSDKGKRGECCTTM